MFQFKMLNVHLPNNAFFITFFIINMFPVIIQKVLTLKIIENTLLLLNLRRLHRSKKITEEQWHKFPPKPYDAIAK